MTDPALPGAPHPQEANFPTAVSDPPSSGGVSGKLVVIALFAFGISTTSFLWFYTYLNNRPFIDLRHALYQEYGRECSPRVEGGQERGRGPYLLRVVINVDFDPTSKAADVVRKVTQMEERCQALARLHHDLAPYEKWAFILVYYQPEGLPKRYEILREMTVVRTASE